MYRFLTVALVVLLPFEVFAQTASAASILNAMRMPDLLRILEEEAARSGTEMLDTMAPDRSSMGWEATVRDINDPAEIGPIMEEAFSQELGDADTGPILQFWSSEEGQKIIGLELSAREVMLDPDVEDAVLSRYPGGAGLPQDRAQLLDEFVQVNQLIEANVVGALNSNVAFLRGLRQTMSDSSFGSPGEADILAEVWSQEQEIRSSVETWLYGFLALAYQPLSDDELRDYIAFSDSEAGQIFNTALIAAFDAVFLATSEETGEALARLLNSEDI